MSIHPMARHLVALVGFVACVSANAGFDGKDFSAYYGYPTPGTPITDSQTFTVTAGAGEAQFFINPTTIDVDFSDTTLSLLLNTTLVNPVWNSASFNGLVFNLTAGGQHGFTGRSVDPLTTMAGFTADRVVLTGNLLTVDWNGLAYANGTKVVIDFASDVPEPASYVLMLLGLAVLSGATIRLRRNMPESAKAAA